MKTFQLKHLFDLYHQPDVIYEYCKSCEHYNKNHSCPDHEENPLLKFNENDLITIYLLKASYSADSDLALEYRITRHALDRSIKAFSMATESEALFPGRCLICDPCKKVLGLPCSYRGRMKYSLETLGFNLDELVKNEFDTELTWDQPEITYIFAVIHRDEITKDFNNFYKSTL